MLTGSKQKEFMETKSITWSFSSAKDFDNCPRKYNETRVLKRFKQGDTTATLYGTAVHLALEEFLRDGTPIPPQFAQFQKYADPFVGIAGGMYLEHKIGVREDFSPCDFMDKKVWWRGIPDLLVVKPNGVALVGDWKTGKSARYADTDQLELLAAAVMQHFPEVHTVKGALIFVVADAVVNAEYKRDRLPAIWSKWAGQVSRIEAAIEHDVWNATPNSLCGFCPVTTCPHNRSR